MSNMANLHTYTYGGFMQLVTYYLGICSSANVLMCTSATVLENECICISLTSCVSVPVCNVQKYGIMVFTI